MIVYYAHAMCLYGEPDEVLHVRTIRRKFRRCRIVNPVDYDGDPLKSADTVGFCLRLVEQCDVVVFARLFGKVTAGVGKEVNHAMKVGKPVFELANGKLIRRAQRVEYISRRDTRGLYRRFRAS